MQGFSEGRAKSVHWVERTEAEKVVFIFTGPISLRARGKGWVYRAPGNQRVIGSQRWIFRFLVVRKAILAGWALL